MLDPDNTKINCYTEGKVVKIQLSQSMANDPQNCFGPAFQAFCSMFGSNKRINTNCSSFPHVAHATQKSSHIQKCRKMRRTRCGRVKGQRLDTANTPGVRNA